MLSWANFQRCHERWSASYAGNLESLVKNRLIVDESSFGILQDTVFYSIGSADACGAAGSNNRQQDGSPVLLPSNDHHFTTDTCEAIRSTRCQIDGPRLSIGCRSSAADSTRLCSDHSDALDSS